jgi:hypothetical protein
VKKRTRAKHSATPTTLRAERATCQRELFKADRNRWATRKRALGAFFIVWNSNRIAP